MTDFIFHKRHHEDDQDAESEADGDSGMGYEKIIDSQAVRNCRAELILNTEPGKKSGYSGRRRNIRCTGTRNGTDSGGTGYACRSGAAGKSSH